MTMQMRAPSESQARARKVMAEMAEEARETIEVVVLAVSEVSAEVVVSADGLTFSTFVLVGAKVVVSRLCP